MVFRENTYLSWYIPRVLNERDVIDMNSSGVKELGPDDFQAATHETWGLITAFEAALAEWLGILPEEVVFTPGATGGNLLALLTLIDSRHEVVVERPAYEPMLRQANRVARVVRLDRSFDVGWRLPMTQARQLITVKTGMVMITEPNNPSGTFSPRDDVIELAAIAKKAGATLLINEVYRGFTERPSYHNAAPNIIIVNSLSKLFGAYWMRLGWLSAPKEIAERLRFAHVNMSLPTACSAGFGLSLMHRAGELELKAKQAVQSGFPLVKKWVEATDGISWQEPHGIGFGCIRIPDGIDDVAFADRLYEKEGVLVIPGSMFELPGTIRLSWLQSGDRLQEGLLRLARSLIPGT